MTTPARFALAPYLAGSHTEITTSTVLILLRRDRDKRRAERAEASGNTFRHEILFNTVLVLFLSLPGMKKLLEPSRTFCFKQLMVGLWRFRFGSYLPDPEGMLQPQLSLPACVWRSLLLFGTLTPWALINEALFPTLYESPLGLVLINYSTAPSAHLELGSLLF